MEHIPARVSGQCGRRGTRGAFAGCSNLFNLWLGPGISTTRTRRVPTASFDTSRNLSLSRASESPLETKATLPPGWWPGRRLNVWTAWFDWKKACSVYPCDLSRVFLCDELALQDVQKIWACSLKESCNEGHGFGSLTSHLSSHKVQLGRRLKNLIYNYYPALTFLFLYFLMALLGQMHG